MAGSKIEKWNARYREGQDDLPLPLPFVVDFVAGLPDGGRALDLACGTGRHSALLAERGWAVTAIDGSDVAIGRISDPRIRTMVADIEDPAFEIPEPPYDLIVDTFFLHRPLFGKMAEAVRPGGVVVLALHLAGSFAIEATELDGYYPDWEVLHRLQHAEVPTIELILRKPTIR